VNIGGRLTLTSGNTAIDGATIIIDPQVGGAHLGSGNHVFGAASVAGITMSAGTLTVVDPLAGSGPGREFLMIAGTGHKTFSGGTIYLGDGLSNASGSTDGFEIVTGGVMLHNLGVNNQQNGSNRFVSLLSSPLTLNGSLTIHNGGELNANGQAVSLAGHWVNDGVFVPGTGTVTFNGTSQTLSRGPAGVVATETFNSVIVAPGAILDTGEDLVAAAGALTQEGALVRTSPGQVVTSGGDPVSFVDARGTGAAILTQTAGPDMGSTTVRTVSNQLPPACNGATFGPLSRPVRRWYEIVPANSGGAATVRLYYRAADPDERNGANADAVEIFHCEPSGWRKLSGACARGSDANGSYVELPGATGFSRFALAEPSPSAVRLDDFQATADPAAGAIDLTWQTAQETNNRGFNLWRGVDEAAPDMQLNAAIIPSQAPGGALGAGYAYTDTRALVPGTTYFYWLEDIGLDGAATRHEPAGVTYAGPTALALRTLRAEPATGLEVTTYAVLAAVAALALAGFVDAVRAAVRRQR
jgi:hypothetical protein